MMKKLLTPKGFTLIELLVVLSIVGILSVVSIAAFVDYSRKEALNAAVSDVATILQTARSRAQSQVKPTTGTCVQAPLDGYRVTIVSQQQYRLEAICAGNSYFLQTKNLPAGITFGSTSTFLFRGLTGGVEPGTIVVSSQYGLQKSIILNTTGTIKVL